MNWPRKIKRPIVALIVLGFAALLPLPAEAGGKPVHKTFKVLIKGFKFVPEKLTVSAGDTVTWVNQDIVPHTATGAKFDSNGLEQGKSWSFKTKKKGVFPYICTFHPVMKGELTVK